MNLTTTSRSLAFFAIVSMAHPAVAAPSTTLDAQSFSNFYTGSDIYDGTSYLNHWSQEQNVTPSLSGSTLSLAVNSTTSLDNGWIEQSSGVLNPWQSTSGAWTFETQLTLSQGDGLFFVLNAAGGATGTIISVGDNGLGFDGNGSNSNQTYSSESNIGTHIFRVAYDSTIGVQTISLWRDGVLITDSIVPFNPLGGASLIVGDSGGAVTVDSFDVHYIAFDTANAYAPIVPTPTALLGSGAMLGLMCFGRKRRRQG